MKSLFNIKERNELKNALEIMNMELPLYIEIMELQAKMRKHNYTIHMKEGFTAEQSLELCKCIPLSL